MNEKALFAGTLAGTLLEGLAPSYGISPFTLGEGEAAMRWPSGIRDVENRIALGGFYGFSVITGKYKLGKSIAAFASAALAAEAGIRVVYVDAELDALQLTTRMQRFGGADWWARNKARFTIRMLMGPSSLQTLVDDIAAQLEPDTDRLLVVLDSISRVAERIEMHNRIAPREKGNYARGIDYWAALGMVTNWCAKVRRLAPTRIGVLVTSEENSHGTSKGQKIEYAGDMALRVKGRANSDVVDLSVPFSREGGEGELGPYTREWRATRFVPVETQMRLVKGEDDW